MASSHCIQCATNEQINNGAWAPFLLGSALAMWLRADLGVSLNGATVSAWADQSGSAWSAAQSDPVRQPTFQSSVAGLGGRPAIEFDGTSDVLITSLLAQYVAPPFTIFIVARSKSPGANTQVYDGAPSPNGRRALYGVDTSSPRRSYSYAGSSINEPASPGWASDTSRVVANVYDGATSAMYVNSETAAVTGNTGGGIPGIEKIGIGAYVDPALAVYAQFWAGYIAEMAVVRGKDAAQRASMMRYLGARYGIAIT